MKTLVLAFLFSCSCILAATPGVQKGVAQPAAPAAPDPFDQVKQMRRGVNILGYDPFWKDETKARFKENHFTRIHDGGFQTVRVNLHAFRYMDSDNRLPAEWLRKLDWIVDKALASKLIVILDEHDFQALGEDATKAPKLLSFWRQISERYQSRPPQVLFEILNEPNSKLTGESWNALLKEALAIIRKTNPTRNVVIGPASWNSITALNTLELPDGDRHIIATVHYYIPMEFTHQGAPWNKSTANLSGIAWGSEPERQRVEKDFAGVQQWSDSHKRPILLGEFGAYDKGDIDSRVRYTSFVARTAESHGWAWAYWQFDGDFVVFDMAKDDWNHQIHRALVP